MKIQNRIKDCFVVLSTALLLPLPILQADEPTFLSLSRRPTLESNLPANVSVVTAEDIEKMGADSLSDILERLPSVDVSRSGSLGTLSTIRLRAATTSNQVQIVIDDQPLGGVSIQEINIDLVPIEDIEKIEIVRGGSSVLYGANTIGGVIHIFTKRHVSDQPTASLSEEVGSYKTKIRRAHIGAKNARVSGTLFINSFETDGFSINSDVKNNNDSGNIGFSFSNGGFLGADVSITDRESGSSNGTSVPMDQWNGHLERQPNSLTQRIENNFVRSLLRGHAPIGIGVIQSVVYNSRETYKLALDAHSNPFASFDNRITGQDTRLLLDQGTTVGVAYERDTRFSLGQIPRHIINWGSYLQHEAKFKKLILTPAVRFDQHSTFGNEWNPRLTAVYRASDRFRLSANAAQAFRAPTLVDLFIVSTDPFFPAFDFFGNPNLKPEKANTYDTGFWFKVGENSFLSMESSVSGFYTKIKDRITTVDTDANGNVDTLQNVSKAEVTGVELESTVQVGKIKNKLSWTLQKGRATSLGSTKFIPIRLTPSYLFNIDTFIPLPFTLEFVNQIRGSGHQFERDNHQGVRLPSYTLWNISLSKKLPFGRVYGSVQNLTGKRYSESVTFGNAVPQPDRTYWTGVEVKFAKAEENK
jgi:outer membrane cobalamin receptor